MDTILTSAIIKNAKETVDTYITTAQGLYQELETVMNTLTTTNFQGDASVGYQEFYKSKVVPALVQNLTAANSSLTASIKGILDSIETQLLKTVDPKLGANNKNPGAGAQ